MQAKRLEEETEAAIAVLERTGAPDGEALCRDLKSAGECGAWAARGLCWQVGGRGRVTREPPAEQGLRWSGEQRRRLASHGECHSAQTLELALLFLPAPFTDP